MVQSKILNIETTIVAERLTGLAKAKWDGDARAAVVLCEPRRRRISSLNNERRAPDYQRRRAAGAAVPH